MADISLTASMRSNLLQLQGTTKLMDMTQERISTGRKINSALDGPVEFFTAKGLTDRAADFAALKDDMGQAISAIESASKSLESIANMVDQAKGLAVSAKAASTSAERATLATQFDDIRAQIDTLAADATYNGVNLMQGRGTITGAVWTDSVGAIDALGGMASTTITGAQSQDFTATVRVEGEASGSSSFNAGANSISAVATGGALTVTLGTQASGGSGTGWTDVAAGNVSLVVSNSGATMTITDGTNSVDIATSTIDDHGESVTVQLGTMDVTLAATNTATSGNALTFTNGTDTVSKTIAGTDKRVHVDAKGHTETIAIASDGVQTFSNSANWGVNGVSINVTEASLVVGNTAGLTRTGVGGTGTNDLSVSFNQDGTAKINVQAQDATTTGLSLAAAQNSWAADSDIDAAITKLDTARDTLRSQTREFSTSLGVIQTREDFTSEFVNALQAGADKLTLADGNEEAANMLALQTRQQLGIQALSMASQSAQSVLSLFR